MNQRDPDKTIIEHDNGFTMVNTRLCKPRMEPYVLPRQCEQVFYSEIPGIGVWSFAVRGDPRERLAKYNVQEYNEDGIEEEYDVEDDQHELDDHVLEEDVEGLV